MNDIRQDSKAPRGEGRSEGRRDNRSNTNQERERSEFVDKLIGVRRVSKTVKGGRRMAFGALVVVGDEAGRVGWGKGKAKEVPDAVRKATDEAKHGMVRVPLRHGRTLHHNVQGKFGATTVVLKPAVPGTGIIAGGPMRAIFEAMGVKDVVAKALGSTNPFNLIQATFAAFTNMETPRGIAAKRGLKVTDLTLHAEQSSKGEVDQKELLEKAQKTKNAHNDNKPARGGRPGADRKRDDRDGGNRGAPRRDAKPAAPKVVTVSKSESMSQAVAAEAPAAPAADKPTE